MLVTGFNVVYIRTPVNGNSMFPTLNSSFETTGKQDIVYINRFQKGKAGDIVVLDLRNHINFDGYAVKTLIATEGDVVNIVIDNINNKYNLLVNDNIFYSKPYDSNIFNNTFNSFQQYISNHINDNSRILKDDSGQIKGVIVKKDEVYVLGDNWDTSKDSSLVGPFNKKSLIGRVDIIIKPNQNEFLTILKGIF